VGRNPGCPVCGEDPTQTELIDYEVFRGLKSAPGATDSDADSASRAGSDSSRVSTEVLEVTPGELTGRLASAEPPVLLDVRESWEWAVGNLSEHGARLIPLGELGSRIREVPTDRSVVVYCRSGQRSRVAVQRMSEAGIEGAASLRGGLKAWADEIDPDLRVV